MPYSSLGRPATAFRPMFGMIDPPKVQTSEPSFCLMIFGCRVLVLRRNVVVEHVRGFHHVVVDADHDEFFGVHDAPRCFARRRARIGFER